MMIFRKNYAGWLIAGVLALSGCMSAQQLTDTMPEQEGENLTAGVVQKEIRIGMSQPDVAAALGSPNLVSRDKDGLETWIYDKISTTSARQSSSGGVFTLLVNTSQVAAVSSQSERTLTVIVKFKDGKVADFSYRTTQF